MKGEFSNEMDISRVNIRNAIIGLYREVGTNPHSFFPLCLLCEAAEFYHEYDRPSEWASTSNFLLELAAQFEKAECGEQKPTSRRPNLQIVD